MKPAALIFVILMHVDAFGQVNSFLERQKSVPLVQRPDIAKIFGNVEKGISSASTRAFASHLGPQVYLNITGQQESYFSANHSAAVLQNYFDKLKPISFAFTRVQEKGENPYATGRLTHSSKGSQESVQIYVSLAFHDSKWVITQFNVY